MPKGNIFGNIKSNLFAKDDDKSNIFKQEKSKFFNEKKPKEIVTKNGEEEIKVQLVSTKEADL